MMFGKKQKTARMMQAIIDNDVAFLRGYLKEYPQLLDQQLSWPKYTGYPMNYAASLDRPDIVQFLALEMKQSANRNDNVANRWTPLHHAKHAKAHAAAAMLLKLGADPKLSNDGDENTVDFANSDPVQAILDPGRLAKKQQREEEEREARRIAAAEKSARAAVTDNANRIAGTWTLTGASEVTHERETPNGKQRLTDVFNFETRIWRTVVSDIGGQGVAQNIFFFDQMPDATILQGAFERLKTLGGTADEASIPAGSLPKKALRAAAPDANP